MSLQDDIEADVADVFLDTSNGFAESITHYPAGATGSPATVTADVQFTAQTGFDTQNIERTYGKSLVIRGRLRVSASLTLLKTDAWLIAGKRYDTESIGAEEFGLVTVEIIRKEPDVSSVPGRSIVPR